MQVFWSSLFILPKKIIKVIESLFRSFFWSGSDLKKHGAKIAWEKLCAPKNEGGLGFKSLEVWNRAVVAKHIWYLFSGGGQSMWCQWVKSYLLKGRSFWKVKIPSDPSWVWRKLLSLRPSIYPLIKQVVGDGSNIFLWYDNWHLLGSLWTRFGNTIQYDTALNCATKVTAIVDNYAWKWPSVNTLEVKELIASTPSSLSPKLGADSIIWTPSSNGKFSIGSTWNFLRKSFDKVTWSGIIWGPHNVPKASLICWMAVQGRLNTGDRVKQFGISQSSECYVCHNPYEDYNHLFFHCPFSDRVWNVMKIKLNVSWPDLPWFELVQLLSQQIRGKSLGSVISRLVFNCTVYQLWMTRNNIFF